MVGESMQQIEWARLTGARPRSAGANARLGEHGPTVHPPIARITLSNGAIGFGWSLVTREEAAGLLGVRLDDVFGPEMGVRGPFRALEYPLLDLAGQLAGEPVYALIGGRWARGVPARVPCYDTSLYFDDLHLDDGDAAALIAAEAREGVERGHRAFKIKVGRGAMHMPLEAGTRRDVAVVCAVREAVGPEATLLIDANNGYNLNLAKTVLRETAAAGVSWIEEAFHEDPVLYGHLKAWLRAQGLPTLIADGEGEASPHLLEWAREGLIDVVQCDIFRPGFSWWLDAGRKLDAWGSRSAPHHYGGHYGNYAACHLAGRIERFAFVEWDEAITRGLDTSAYTIDDGMVSVPELPGFGLRLDEAVFEAAVDAHGFRVCIGD